MKLTVEIEVDDRLVSATRWALRRRTVMILVVLALVGGTVAYAGPFTPTKVFMQGEVISADDMNTTFREVARAGTVVEFAGKAYSTNAVFCGATEPTVGLIPGGYAGAKTLCEAACGDSPTAHMCTGEELLRFNALGGVVATAGWYSNGIVAAGILTGEGTSVRDCTAWTDSTSGSLGPTWGTLPSFALCNEANPIVCCD